MQRDQVYWDSNAFLVFLNDEDGSQDCANVLKAARSGTVQIVTSALTLAEVLYVKGQPKLDPSKREKVDAFFKSDFISVRNVTRLTSELARDLVWDSNIKPKDAIHVATACLYKLPVLQTFDEDLLKKGSVTLAGHTVRLQKPKIIHQVDWVEGKDGPEKSDGLGNRGAEAHVEHAADTTQAKGREDQG